jgi:hypothetical protein
VKFGNLLEFQFLFTLADDGIGPGLTLASPATTAKCHLSLRLNTPQPSDPQHDVLSLTLTRKSINGMRTQSWHWTCHTRLRVENSAS